MARPPFETRTGPVPKATRTMRAGVDWMARSPGRAFVVIFLLSFAIRSYLLTLVPREYILPHTPWEMEAVATSLVQSGQFADPYVLPTGPAAHLPSILPSILGLIWHLFGMGLAAGYAAWLFRLASYSAVYAILPWFADRLRVERQVGVLTGAFFAVWPGHGEALTVIVLGLLLIAFLRRWSSAENSLGGSIMLRLAACVAFHLQPELSPGVEIRPFGPRRLRCLR